MPLFAHAFGDFVFICLCALVVGIGFVLFNLPRWAGRLGGSLGLWTWKPDRSEFDRVRAAIEALKDNARDLSSQGRKHMEWAEMWLTEAEAANGFAAFSKLRTARGNCRAAVYGCTLGVISAVYAGLKEDPAPSHYA